MEEGTADDAGVPDTRAADNEGHADAALGLDAFEKAEGHAADLRPGGAVFDAGTWTAEVLEAVVVGLREPLLRGGG